MRFRASLQNVLTFQRIIQTIGGLSKICILKFSEAQMVIICEKAGEGAMQIWSVIKVATLFSDYRIQSNSNNEIAMCIGSEALSHALKSALTSPEVTMKLAKKNGQAVLSFEIILQTRQDKKVAITQDVKIEIMKPIDIENLKEPLCPEPDVHIVLPPLFKLRTVTDHLRQMSDVLGISANAAGHLKLFIGTEAVKVSTEWSDCIIHPLDNDDDEHRDPDAYASTLVYVKTFLKFLSCYAVSSSTIASICHNHCLIMHVYIGEIGEPGGVLTFYIPAVHRGIDD